MTKLWKIEDEVRGKNADIRAAFRQEQSETIVARLFDLWERNWARSRASPGLTSMHN